jgi:hypothetical protein
MDKKSLFLIGNISGFTPQIARLISMMNYVRHTTISAGWFSVFTHEVNHSGQIRLLRKQANQKQV